MDSIANPSITQQRRDRLRLAQERKDTKLKRAHRFLTPRNSNKGGCVDVRK